MASNDNSSFRAKVNNVQYFLGVVALLAVVLVLLAVWRFVTLRSRGTAVIMRRMPAEGAHGWRHGILRYTGSSLEYYKLRSIVPFANSTFQRKEVELRGHRDVSVHEASFLLPATKVLSVRCAGQDFEFALEPRAEMAFTAWLEAAPDARMERIDPKALRRRMSGNGQRR